MSIISQLKIRISNCCLKIFSKFIYHVMSLKRQHYRDREQLSGCQGLQVGDRLTTDGQHKRIFECDRTVPYLDCGGGYITICI